MDDNSLRYVEMVHSARHSGNLSTDSWESSILCAFSWAGRLNPLAAALVDWLDGFKPGPEFMAKYLLSGELQKLKICPHRDAVDVAEYGMTYYKNSNCDKCDGRGVLDIYQTQCPFCDGTGKKPIPSGPTYNCWKLIEATLSALNEGLKYRMRGCKHKPEEKAYTLSIYHNHDFTDSMPVCGMRTPISPRCE